MSWKWGNQVRPTLSAECWNPSLMYSRLYTRFSWLTITPFGIAVEPEVYCRKATDAGDTLGSRHSSANAADILSVPTQHTSLRGGSEHFKPFPISSSLVVVRTADGRE